MSVPANYVPLDMEEQMIESILNQLDMKLSELRDALRGTGNRTLTDLYNKLDLLDNALATVATDKLRVSVVDALPRSPFYLVDSGGTELSSYIKNLNTSLSSRASESTLSGIKTQTDKLTFDGSSYLYVNAAVVANPSNLDVALSTRASESTLSGIKTQTDKLTFDGSSYLYVNAAVVANPSNLDVALSTRASESTLSTLNSKFPSASALGDSLSNPTTTIIGSALLGFDGSRWRRLRLDTTGRMRTVVESMPALPSGTNVIGGVFADYSYSTSINQQVSTTEVVGSSVDVRRGGRKVIIMRNTQNVDVTITIEGSPDGSNWFTIRSGITVAAGSYKIGILTDAYGYIRARAIASSAPSSGTVVVYVSRMT